MKNKLLKGMVTLAVAAAMLIQTAPVEVHAEGGELTGKTATEITEMMGKGWNLGNTLDAQGGKKNDVLSHETAWGNPVVTKELIDGVKAAGFTTIRIPTTWYTYIDKGNNYAIAPEYMARVKEIVDYAYDDGLFIIINVHHEGWVNRKDLDSTYKEVGKELAAVWAQIADTFADYDQHLIFEGMNEPRAQGTGYEWTGNKACYDAVNYLDQLFVETIKNNGKGHNSERMLMVPGYAASSNPEVLKSIKLPEINGETATNLCVSVHCYSPYNFCLSDNQTTFDPKNSGDTADINSLFRNLKSLFLDNGIPVVMGECGATNSGDNNSARLAWFAYMGAISSEYGVPAIVWDNGAGGKSGGECHKYFNRKTGEAVSQDLIDAFVNGEIPEKAEDTVITFEPVKDGSNTIILKPDELGFTSSKLPTQMKINHTEDVAMGFSLKVDETVADYCAELKIKKYAGHTVRIGAWIYSEDDANVSVGINDGALTEMATVKASAEWSQVLFDVNVPEGGDWKLFFKGDAKFFVDDISMQMDPTDALPEVNSGSDNAAADENTSDAGNKIDAAVSAEINEVQDTEKSSLPIIMIVTAIVAVAAVGVIVVGNRKKK